MLVTYYEVGDYFPNLPIPVYLITIANKVTIAIEIVIEDSKSMPILEEIYYVND